MGSGRVIRCRGWEWISTTSPHHVLKESEQLFAVYSEWDGKKTAATASAIKRARRPFDSHPAVPSDLRPLG